MKFLKIMVAMLATFIIIAQLTSCANTSITSTSRDASFSKNKLGKIFVISLLKNQRLRQNAEDEFVKQFSRQGITATPSYTVFRTGKETDKENAMKSILQSGCTTVLVSRPLGITPKPVNDAPIVYTGRWSTNNWYTYYRETYSPDGADVDVDIANSDTAVYALEDEKLLWSVQTQTELTHSPTNRDIEKGVSLVIKSLLAH